MKPLVRTGNHRDTLAMVKRSLLNTFAAGVLREAHVQLPGVLAAHLFPSTNMEAIRCLLHSKPCSHHFASPRVEIGVLAKTM